MKKEQNQLIMIVLIIMTILPGVQLYSCAYIHGQNLMNDDRWTRCYQDNSGNVLGYQEGSLSASWWDETSSWGGYNYNNHKFYQTTTYYTQTNRIYQGVDWTSSCWSCNNILGLSCVGGWWSPYSNYYYECYNGGYSDTNINIYVYKACHLWC